MTIGSWLQGIKFGAAYFENREQSREKSRERKQQNGIQARATMIFNDANEIVFEYFVIFTS